MIKKDAVVSLSYTLTNADGQELDKSTHDKPFAYLHGNKQIVPGLENALEGMTIGDKKEVTVPPAEGYGEFAPGLKMDIERSNFPKDIKYARAFFSRWRGRSSYTSTTAKTAST